jgi:5,10-methylenetetrahydromethanopterin reductase
MRIAMGAGSEVLGTPMRPQDIVGDVVAAEAEGFGSAGPSTFAWRYRRLLDREGAESPGALAVTGDEAAIGKQLRRLADAGVTELWPIIFPVGDDPGRSRRETWALLRELATTS